MKAFRLLALSLGLAPVVALCDDTPVASIQGTYVFDFSTKQSFATLTLPTFTSTWGTLQGVNLTLTVNTESALISADNDTSNPASVSAYVDSYVKSIASTLGATSLQGTGITASALSAGTTWSSGEIVLKPSSGDLSGFTNTGNSDFTSMLVDATNRDRGGNVLSTYIDLYNSSTSGNSFSLLVYGSSSANISATTSGDDRVYTNGSTVPTWLIATVQYTYTPVPEPSTYALFLGVGTLGLVGWRRFRRK
jgi:hypothetical protein